MTETDAIVALAELGSTGGTYIAMHYSFTFAYLTVAYLIGAKLSTFQCIAISGLYSVTAFFSGATGVGYAQAWLNLHNRESTILHTVWIFDNLLWTEGLVFVMAGGVILSLYFMYNVRHGIAAQIAE